MKYCELVILLSCHGMEDFPLYHTGTDAEGLLSAWCGLWHPALLASAEGLPVLRRTDDPPEDLTGRVIVIPRVSEAEVPVGFAQRAEKQGACVIRRTHSRSEVVKAALADLDGGDGAVDAELAADFLALAYCYLQVAVLTRQMRYTDNLDELHFQDEVVAAAKSAVAGDRDTAKQHLAGCFDVLAESKDQAYPVDFYLVDLTLCAETTLGPALAEQLAGGAVTNLLAPAAVVERMADEEPQTLAALREALAAGTADVAGGELEEGPLPLLPREDVLDQLRQGLAVYDRLLGHRPRVFARRRFGLSPIMPQVLHNLGFVGALHATLDDGRFPQASGCKIRWEGLDTTAVEALTRVPLDAARPESFLRLAEKLNESMDSDQVATVCFAHWPGQICPWYEDLRRIAAHGPALGRFVTLGEYFRDSAEAVDQSRFAADQYRSAYLKQAIVRREENPISTHVERHRRRAEQDAARALETLAALLAGDPSGTGVPPGDHQNSHGTGVPPGDHQSDRGTGVPPGDHQSDRGTGVPPGDHQSDRGTGVPPGDHRRDAGATSGSVEENGSLDQSMTHFAGALPRAASGSAKGYLIANPLPFDRRVGVDVSQLRSLPNVESPVHEAQENGSTRRVVVDVPAMGYAWVAEGRAARPPARGKAPPPLAEKNLLRNEFFEVQVDPTTGAVRAIYDYVTRGNRLSQQLAFRRPGPRPQPGDVWRDPDETADYSVMAADSIEVTSAGPALGEITSRGRLLKRDGTPLARFEQTLRLWKGSRVLLFDVTLDPQAEPRADPWNSYYAARFAWNDATADTFRSVALTSQPTELKRMEAPHFVHLRGEKTSTTILTAGLPYHKRTGIRVLDSLLVVRGERARRFRFGVGIDLKYPLPAALAMLAPQTHVVQSERPPSAGAASWLVHLGAKNACATHWEPLVENGRVVGVRARILETEGRPSRCRFRSFRPLVSARHVDFLGATLAELKIDEGAALVELAKYEWVEVEARWSS